MCSTTFAGLSLKSKKKKKKIFHTPELKVLLLEICKQILPLEINFNIAIHMFILRQKEWFNAKLKKKKALHTAAVVVVQHFHEWHGGGG